MLGSVREANAIVTIAYRDVLKFTRDPSRLIATLVLPVLLVGLFGEGLQATLGSSLGYNYLTFVFLGVFAQTLPGRSEEHTSELQSRQYLVCRLLLEKKNMSRQSQGSTKSTRPTSTYTNISSAACSC